MLSIYKHVRVWALLAELRAGGVKALPMRARVQGNRVPQGKWNFLSDAYMVWASHRQLRSQGVTPHVWGVELDVGGALCWAK